MNLQLEYKPLCFLNVTQVNIDNFERRNQKVKSKTRIFVIVGLSVGIIALGLGTFIFVRNSNQAKNDASEASIAASHTTETSIDFWSSASIHDYLNYKAIQSQASSVVLNKTVLGHTVYLDSAGKPFVISGINIIHLTKNSDGSFSLPAVDSSILREEATGIKEVFITDSDKYSKLVEEQKQAALDANSNDIAKETKLIVNDSFEYQLSVQGGKTFGNYSDYFNIADILKYCGVTYQNETNSDNVNVLKLDWKLWSGETKSAEIPINTSTGTFVSKDKSTEASVRSDSDGSLYISASTLNDVVGFDAEYNAAANKLIVITDTTDIVAYSNANVMGKFTINSVRAVSLSKALASGALSSEGQLSSSAVSKYTAAYGAIAVKTPVTTAAVPATRASSESPANARSEIISGATSTTTTTTITMGDNSTNGGGSKNDGGSTTNSKPSTSTQPSTSSREIWPEPAAASASDYTADDCIMTLNKIYKSTDGFEDASKNQISLAISVDKLLGTVYSTTDDWSNWNGGQHGQLWQLWDSQSGRDGTSDGHGHTTSGW